MMALQQTLATLRMVAKKHGLLIKNYKDGYVLVDMSTGAVAVPNYPMTFDELHAWLRDIEEGNGSDQ